MKLKSLMFVLAAVLVIGILNVPIASADNFGGPGNAGPPEEPPQDPPCEDDCTCEGPGEGNGSGGPGGPSGRSGSPISYYSGGESLTLTDLRLAGEFPISR